MNRDVLYARMESLRHCLARIESKTPESAEMLARDLDAQDIICLNLERAVQVCVDMAAHVLSDREAPAPESMASAFLRLRDSGVLSEATAERMVKAVGFRNVAVHQYQEIDWKIVYAIITQRLDDFRHYAREIEVTNGKNVDRAGGG
jgi:uncharacterized protein YutE (UPF0331/DUF86 family)